MEKKFEESRKRDQRVLVQFIILGWRAVLIWECATRNGVEFSAIIKMLDELIHNKISQFVESSYGEMLNKTIKSVFPHDGLPPHPEVISSASRVPYPHTSYVECWGLIR